jgi:hypothetical protein
MHDVAARDAQIQATNPFHFTPFWRMGVTLANIDNPNIPDDEFKTPDDISRSYSRPGLTPLWQGHEPHMDEEAWNPSAPIPGETPEPSWTTHVQKTFSTLRFISLMYVFTCTNNK